MYDGNSLGFGSAALPASDGTATESVIVQRPCAVSLRLRELAEVEMDEGLIGVDLQDTPVGLAGPPPIADRRVGDAEVAETVGIVRVGRDQPRERPTG